MTLHKNTVQYRIRKAEESLGRPVAENRHDVELACGPATGSARPCWSRPGNDRQPRLASARPGTVTAVVR